MNYDTRTYYVKLKKLQKRQAAIAISFNVLYNSYIANDQMAMVDD